MKRQLGFLLCAIVGSALPAYGQAPREREDAIWARVAGEPIVLDGVLDEPSWAAAESVVVKFHEDNGIPGSGWKYEGGRVPVDSTCATLKLLVYENQMYLGAFVPDASVGGSLDFNRFDGFLMSIKDHADPNAPKPPAEYFYSWWYPETPDPQPVGMEPGFIGRWATWPPDSARTPEQIANWDAVTVVHGLSNSDTTLDMGYTVEMRFNLTPMGYDVTRPEGDVVEWNISIYDGDWYWPLDGTKVSFNRVWWQSPWGNAMWYDEVHVFCRPDVTVSSGSAPFIEPELTIYEVLDPPPTIDGALTEPVWDNPLVYSFDIRYGDMALRQTYPGVGPYRAGQYQPEVNGGLAAVLDPGDATVKTFFKGDSLYLGFDVRDQVVQYHTLIDRWDGFIVTINDRATRGADQNLMGQRLSFQVAADGSAEPQDYLNSLVTSGDASVAVHLNPGTTVDTLGMSADNGYTAELCIDLTSLGYPSGLGDRALFLGVTLLDGDSFTPYTDSYGTRTWWFRQYEDECCPAWVHMSSQTAIGAELLGPPLRPVLIGSYPNPASRQQIRYSLAAERKAVLEVFDVQGRLVARRDLGIQDAGDQEVRFDGTGLGAGLYPYRLVLQDPGSGERTVLNGRMILLD